MTVAPVQDWLTSHPWISNINLSSARAYFVRPTGFVILPEGDVPADLVETVQKRIRFEAGKSLKVLCLESGLNPSSEDLLGVVGMRAGLWSLWPRHDDPVWAHDVGLFPTVSNAGIFPKPAEKKKLSGKAKSLSRR